MPSFSITADADGTIDTVDQFDSDSDFIYFDDCNDTPDGGSADYIASSSGTSSSWLRLEDVPSDFNSLSSLSMDVDVWGNSITGTLDAQIFDSDSGGSENPLTDEQEIASGFVTTRTQQTVNFGSLTGSKTQWNNAYLKLTFTISSGANDLRLYGFTVDGVYAGAAAPDAVAPRIYSPAVVKWRGRSHFRGGVLDKALGFSALVAISEEQTLLFAQDPSIEGGNLASGRWRR